MKNTKRRRYSEAFKREAVKRVLDQKASSHSVSRSLGISQLALSKWVKKFNEEGSSVFSGEESEVKRLRAKVKRLQDEKDILKKAVSFFTQPGE